MALYLDYDQAGLDAQYDLKARHPCHPDFFAKWAADGERVRANPEARLDLAYGDGPNETLDLFPAAPGSPTLVFIHGGYWRSMDKSDFCYPAPVFVDAGVNYVAINYALAPSVTLATIVDQCVRALDWLGRQGAELGLDPARLHIAGHSAGGHLIAAVASHDFAADALPADLIKSACGISGLYDLEPLRLCFLNEDIRLDAAEAARLSPINHLPDRAGPLILAVGALETDEFHRQQAVYADAWHKRGLPLEIVELPGRNHFTAVDALAEPGHPLFRAVLRQILE